MREFFKGWRRKVGCVALVMAVFVTMCWLRSQNHADEIRIDLGDGFRGVSSIRGYFIFFSHFRNPKGETVLWKFNEIPPMPEVGYALLPLWNFEDYAADGAAIRQWLFALPLTLLSAYLLLWKPRPKDKPNA